MIRDIVWACIACGVEGALDDAGTCRSCGAQYRRGRGADILVNGKPYQPREIVKLLPHAGSTGKAHVVLRESAGDKPVHALGQYLGKVEVLGEPRAAQVTLDAAMLRIAPAAGATIDIPLIDITAIQPSSHTLQIKSRGRAVLSLRFTASSPKLWEERLQHALADAYQRAGQGSVVEYQPRVCTRRAASSDGTATRIRNLVKQGFDKRPHAPWQTRLCKWIARNAWRRFGGGVSVEGLEHIPERGPFLVLPNHQSYLETMLVPAVISRPLYPMAKSTQFSAPLVGWLMARLLTFPVRRFEIDPQAVRFMLRRFGEGYGALIFIEGERTWDGDVQAMRHGAVRLALKAGVPVIPCRVSGAFEAWPRWSSWPQRHPVRISFERPLDLPVAATRGECEAQLEPAMAMIHDALAGRV